MMTTNSDQESHYGLLDVMANGMHDVVWQGSPSGSYAGHPGNPIWQGDIPNVNYICGKVGE